MPKHQKTILPKLCTSQSWTHRSSPSTDVPATPSTSGAGRFRMSGALNSADQSSKSSGESVYDAVSDDVFRAFEEVLRSNTQNEDDESKRVQGRSREMLRLALDATNNIPLDRFSSKNEALEALDRSLRNSNYKCFNEGGEDDTVSELAIEMAVLAVAVAVARSNDAAPPVTRGKTLDGIIESKPESVSIPKAEKGHMLKKEEHTKGKQKYKFAKSDSVGLPEDREAIGNAGADGENGAELGRSTG